MAQLKVRGAFTKNGNKQGAWLCKLPAKAGNDGDTVEIFNRHETNMGTFTLVAKVATVIDAYSNKPYDIYEISKVVTVTE